MRKAIWLIVGVVGLGGAMASCSNSQRLLCFNPTGYCGGSRHLRGGGGLGGEASQAKMRSRSATALKLSPCVPESKLPLHHASR